MSENIYSRMLKVTKELNTVAKNLTVKTGERSSYKAVSEKDILDAVKPLEAEYGIYSYPVDRRIIEQGLLDLKEGRKARYIRIEVKYRFVNIDEPNEYIEVVSYADGLDSGDKAPGKAMTYADKYALMKAYKISTGEDPDANASVEIESEQITRGATESQIAYLKKLYDERELFLEMNELGVTNVNALSVNQASVLIKKKNG